MYSPSKLTKLLRLWTGVRGSLAGLFLVFPPLFPAPLI